MLTAHQDRPNDIGVMVSRTVLAVVRILIASYFLATATGLIFEPASRTFLSTLLPQAEAQFLTTTYLFMTSFAIMVGVLVRPAALLLAVYIFWSGFVHYDLGDPVALAAFWRYMALLGAVLMIAATEQGAGAQVRVWRRNIEPRRISRTAQNRADRDTTPRPSRRREESGAAVAGFAYDSGEIDIFECDPEDAEDAAEFGNLFADIWDKPIKHSASA